MVMMISDETGEGKMTVHQILPGIMICLKVFMGLLTGRDFVSFLNLTGHQFVVPFLRTTLFVITNKFLCMILIINILLRFLWIQI